MVPLFASLLSLPTDTKFPSLVLPPVRERQEMFRALKDWLRAYSEKQPVLFIVEDLHWLDASTLEFLGEFLAEGLHDRILTLLTFRPEFRTPWAALSHQTSLALNRLTKRQVGDLMRKKTGSNLPEACSRSGLSIELVVYRYSLKNSRRWCRNPACWIKQVIAASE